VEDVADTEVGEVRIDPHSHRLNQPTVAGAMWTWMEMPEVLEE